MQYTDKTLHCVACGGPFLWSATEQFLYAGRGLRHEPKRCPACRAQRHAPRDRVGALVVCAQCGTQATLRFQPREGRPVYCDACYTVRRSAGQSPGPR